MEDFTSFCKNLKKTQATSVKPLVLDSSTNTPVIPNEYGGIYDRPKKPKISFLQSRLNKDNFWNLMFFVGMNLGFGIAGLIMTLTNNNTLFSIAMWVVILTVPYIIKKNSLVTFDKESLQFFNRNNEALTDRAPNFFLLLIVTFAGGGFTAFILVSLKDFINPSIFPAIFTVVLIFVPTMYCILKNYPIAVYFKKEAYIGDGTARSYVRSHKGYREHSRFSRDISQINSPYNRMHNPINNYSAMNSHYRK